MQTDHFLVFGEVLYDSFPNGASILGGAPFNVAWHLQAFKQSPILITCVGNDRSGLDIRSAMRGWGMSEAGLQIDPDHPTGKVSIFLSSGEPTYQILDNQAYDYISCGEIELPDCQFLYHGSLALRHAYSRSALEDLKRRHQGKVFLDVNLRTPWWDPKNLSEWLNGANWVKLNDDEFQLLYPDQQAIELRMQTFIKRYQLDGIVVTCGGLGAFAMLESSEFIHVKPDRPVVVKDTVGAGDAFSAVLLLGICHGWPMSVTMGRAQSLASAIVEQAGAVVDNLDFYRTFISEWS